jgi:BirA family biotin operon repressor/biotin-[acetyl-CoA-carboxylase] ligase
VIETSGELLMRLAAFGRVYLLDTVTSTNDRALSLAARHERCIVIARSQTRGRGRFRRPWFSDPGSLTATLLVFRDQPGFPRPDLVTSLAGLALAQAVEQVAGLNAQIRWPNDIVFQEKKLAGLLCESRGSAIAVGLGVNVNQTSLPADLPDAASIRLASGAESDPLVLLEAFLGRFDTALRQAGAGDAAALIAAIKNRSATLHRRIEVVTLFRRQAGTAIDIDSEGRIVLRTDSGRLVVLGAGQVRRLT